MHLSLRPAEQSELPALFDRFGDRWLYPLDLRASAARLWMDWYDDGTLTAVVYEDMSDSETRCAVGVAASVFVSESFYQSARVAEEPSVRADLVCRTLAGELVVLRPSEARAANRGDGLHLFFLAAPVSDPRLDGAALIEINERWGEELYAYRACKLRSLTWECLGEAQLDLAQACGVRLAQDWAASWAANRAQAALLGRPYLTSISREEALSRFGTHIWYVFSHTAARLGLTATQQEMLTHALEGLTDEELAEILHLSLSAVKKRWLVLYERVSLAAPEILPLDDDGGSRGLRGVEKRRHLVRYLRLHPEELHPLNAIGL